MTIDELRDVKQAVEACRYEFVTLSPRLTEPFRRNAEACIGLCDDALLKINDELKRIERR